MKRLQIQRCSCSMRIQGTFPKTGLVFACFLSLAAPSMNAQKVIKRCAGVEARSMKVSLKTVQDVPLDAQQETIETSPSAAGPKVITVVARGPILGSMDSETLHPDLACSSDGLVLTVTISRSAHYHGAVRQNVLWSPRITILVGPLQPEIALQVVWKMRLTNGREVDHARTPPYPEKKYPITVTKTIHWRQN